MAALQWTREHATLLVVIPICNMWAMGWVYTALPLFWLDQGWSLLSLGTLMGLGNAGRAVFTSNLIRYFGDWAVLPWMCVLICGGVVTAARPYEMWAVCVGIAACQNGQFMLALRGLSFFAFSGTGRLRTSAAECSTDFTTTTTSSTRDGSCHDLEHGSLELHNQALRVLTICLGSLRGNSFTCTKVTTICNATATNPDLATCNRAWCCEGDNYEDWYENGFPDASGLQKKGCVAKGPDESIVDKQDKQDKSHLYSEYCTKKEPIPGCNCHIEIDRKGKRELKCHDSIFLEGKPDNYSWERSNFFPLFIIAMIAMHGGWIVPFTFFLVKQCRACKFLTNEYFKDWQAQGIGVTYIAPGKHNSGSLGLVVPANNGGRPQQGQRVIMAEVVTVSGAQVLPTK